MKNRKAIGTSSKNAAAKLPEDGLYFDNTE
jgi:hypothetical protein